MTEWDEIARVVEEARNEADDDVVPEWLREMIGPKDDEERHRRRIALISEVVRLREERENLHVTIAALVEAGQGHLGATEAIRQALGSVIDVLDELCMGLSVGQTPDREWGEAVSSSLGEHRRTLGFTGPDLKGTMHVPDDE